MSLNHVQRGLIMTIEDNTEGLETFGRVTVKNGIPVEGKVVWVINEAVPIINGRIKFYSKEFDSVFDIPVIQQKGQGVYYVHEWTKLNRGCLQIITWWIEQGEEFYEEYHTAENILNKYKESKSISSGSFAGRISELRGLRLLFQSSDNSDMFKLDWSRAKEIINKGGALK